MRNLTDEQKDNYIEWSEGNKYLYELLCSCWENEITTYASCGGHENGNDSPYLGIVINSNSLPFIQGILGQIQNIQNINVTANVRYSNDNKLLNDDFRALVFYAHNYNCCEMFYKIKKGIEDKENKIELNPKADLFYYNIQKLNETKKEELQEDVNNDIIVARTFRTTTSDFIEYKRSKELVRNSKFMRFIRKRLPFNKTNLKRYEELQQKYGFLQREYMDYNYEDSTRLGQYRVEIIENNEVVQNNINKEKSKNIEFEER